MTPEIKQRIEQIQNGEIPEGYKKTRAGIMPYEWCAKKEYKAKDIFCSVSDKNHNGDYEILSATQDRGIIPRSQVDIDIKYDVNNTSGYKKVEKGDFVISLRSFQGGIEYSEYTGLVSPAYTVLKPKTPICDGYYKSYFKTNDFICRLNKGTYGIRDGKQVGFKDFGEMVIHFPPLPEQQKIARILATQDKIIECYEKKIEQLKQMKKYYLQNMFPKHGETVPKIRFKGFTEPWEQRKLGDIADIVGGGTPSTQNSDFWDGDIDWYTPVDVADQIYISASERKITQIGYDNSTAKMLPVGTVLFTSRAGIGKTAILRKIGCTNQGFQSIVPHDNELDSYFIFSRTEELKRYAEILGAGSTFVEVSGKQMAKISLMIPKEISEQQKIGSFFSAYDTLFILTHSKLEEEKKKIKALQQLLLTGIVRVKL